MGDWTLFSNHGHVLLFLAGHHDARLRDVAERVGITERAVQKIVRELQAAGYLNVTKHGRCNRYRVNARKSLRHPIEAHCPVTRLVQLIVRKPGSEVAITTEAPADPAQTTPERLPRETVESAPRQGRKPHRPAAERPAGQAKTDRGKPEADEPLGKRQQRSLF
jgi:hypothetical protein